MNNNYRHLSTTVLIFLTFLAFYYLQASLVEGCNSATSHATAAAAAAALAAKTTATSTSAASTISIIRSWSAPFAATAFVLPSKIAYIRKGKSLRNSYISKFTHHYPCTNKSSRFFTNQKKGTIDDDDGTTNELAEEDDDDDESTLQKLYRQVQMEDSEWYYRTFSKLIDGVVDDDTLELSLCEKSGTNDSGGKETKDGNNHDHVGLEKKRMDEQSNDNANEFDEKEQCNTNSTEGLDDETGNKNIDSKEIKMETSPPLEGSETDHPEVMKRSNVPEDEARTRQILKDGEQENEEKVEDVKQESSFRDTIVVDTVQKFERENEEPLNDKMQIGNKERNNRIVDEIDVGEGAQPARIKLPANNNSPEPNADTQPTKSFRTRPPSLVRLRNTYTGEVVKLCTLSTLLNAGFSKKEILVLRPKVLELIIEDGIGRPKKGLPKRWVRLSKLEGYDGTSEEEDDDEDFDWEVEIIDTKTSEKLSPASQDREPILKKKDTDEGDDVEEISRGTSKQPEQSSYAKNQGQASESWGPFTSTRLPNSDDDEEEEEEEDAKRKRRIVQDQKNNSRRYEDVQLPPPNKTLPAIGRPSYDEEDDDIDEQRSPQSLRRKRVDGFDYRSKTPSQRSTANQQQRRRRQRPIDQRRELVIDRGDDDEPPPNKFWMDLPTFRDYLRTEAQLRLKILGPDWKESVLDESRWRYDLYKTWLTMLGEGIGENPLYEYGDRPRAPEERRRYPPPPPRSRGGRETGRSKRERPRKRDFEDVGYEVDYDDENRPRRRSKISLEEQKYRSGGERISADRLPRPQSMRGSAWRNFSDLEESLQNSRQAIPRSVRKESMVEEDEENVAYYFDDADEGTRSRSTRSSQTKAWREYIEPHESERTARERKGTRSKMEVDDFDETE